MRVWTIGYERLLPEQLVAELAEAGVERVVDVRVRPQSRRAGMSKTRLGAALGEAGIGYESRRVLGTPPDLKHLFRSGRVAEGAAGYAEHVRRDPEVVAAVEALAAELPDVRTALLCFEADPATCHRRVLVEALAERVPGLQVVDL